MSSKKLNLNKEIIALFSGQSSVVTTPKLYIQLTGSHSLAVVLNQCVYWSNKSECKDGWFYKEYEEWFDEIHIPERTLRRRFEKLEEYGWITTKVKMVCGKNTKHVQPHMDKIIESISIMLNQECPNRPDCPNGSKEQQNPCTNIAPSGQSGRSEPANLADTSIYTEDYSQKKLTNCEESSSSFVFSDTLDPKILEQKLSRDSRADDDFLSSVKYHVENCSDKKYPFVQRTQAALKLLKKLKEDGVIFYTSFDKEHVDNIENTKTQPKKAPANETDQQRQERQFFTYELMKEKQGDYVSKALQQFPEMREKYAKYA